MTSPPFKETERELLIRCINDIDITISNSGLENSILERLRLRRKELKEKLAAIMDEN